jgi:hypothetical protein
MSGIRMFAGELDGQLEPSYIGFRANNLRHQIGRMFPGRLPERDGWIEARKAGWRIVRVVVTDERQWRNFRGLS